MVFNSQSWTAKLPLPSGASARSPGVLLQEEAHLAAPGPCLGGESSVRGWQVCGPKTPPRGSASIWRVARPGCGGGEGLP